MGDDGVQAADNPRLMAIVEQQENTYVKTLILIGDSSRMEYQQMVQVHLGGTVDVWGPQDNGGDSRNVLDHLNE